MPGAVAEEFASLHRRLHWGVDPVSVWGSVEGPLEPLGRSMARAHESGASVQHAVSRLAADLRGQSRERADAKARTIEVRAAAPLGLCFLPAFVLLGVVPMVVALFSSLAIFR
jgi:Flp pilus assembly protein TadB